jgi:digalactosyldiacylglycerol synthase
MRARANSFKNLANSFDREIENFFNSASIASFSVPSPLKSSTSPTEVDFVKKLRPKFSEIRRVYSAPEISKKVLEKWGPRAKLGIDLSAIKNAIVAGEKEGEERRGVVGLDRRRRLGFREFWGDGKEGGGGQFGEWKPIRVLKRRLREFEKKSEFGEIFGGFKNSEFVEKLKSSLVCLSVITIILFLLVASFI